MIATKLPSKLGKEPLIDVIFEIRFTSDKPASAVLPGLLFSQLIGVTTIEPLPASQLPQQIREMDPNLHFSALSRLRWGRFAVLVGDRSLGVGCTMPYPGWVDFKIAIELVMRLACTANLMTSIDRYSIKYVDFFDTNGDYARAFGQFNIAVRIGKHEVRAESSIIRVEIPRTPFTHAVHVMTNASVQSGTSSIRTGAILDVDTLVVETISDVATFVTDLPHLLDAIHLANKQMFFECLSDSGLNNLDPKYE